MLGSLELVSKLRLDAEFHIACEDIKFEYYENPKLINIVHSRTSEIDDTLAFFVLYSAS